MPRKSKSQVSVERIGASMQMLVGLPEFDDFMAQIEDLKDAAVEYSINYETTKSERECLVAKGEIRAYLQILQAYEGVKEQVESAKNQAVQVAN